MRRFPFSFYSGPLVAFGALLALACLACSWYINRLQADLARAVRLDAAGLAAAVDLQVQLRHLRVHSLVLVADQTPARREVVRGDLERVETALDAIEVTATTPEDRQLAENIRRDFIQYRTNLGLDHLPTLRGPVQELAQWSDEHHMAELIDLCRELADRQRDRMQDGVERTETQTAWAGRVLFVLGLAGVFAGLVCGYATARALTHRVAQLFIRVQAVQAELDQDVGAMTVQSPSDFGDLDEQLDRVVGRVNAVCRRLQEQERELLRAEQLAAVGQLAAGVAHEIRNPLTGVKFLLQAAVRPQNPTALTVERLQLLLQEVGRIERTVQGLMDLAAGPPQQRTLHDLYQVVTAAIQVAQSRAERKSITLGVDAPVHPLSVAIDRDQILSLLTNLLFNAIDAAPAGSDVRLSIAATTEDAIEIVVLDEGPGIDQTVAGRLFTPFTTTKSTGTGLGLTVARRVAHAHGGDLVAEERPGGGACFKLTLPRLEEAHAEAAGRG